MASVLAGDSKAPAIAEPARKHVTTYAELADAVAVRESIFATHGVDLLFLGARQDLATVVDYLACRQSGTPVLLLDPAMDTDGLGDLVSRYRPDALTGFAPMAAFQNVDNRNIDGGNADSEAGLQIVERRGSALDLAEKVAVLLPTSGSTGSPKLVQLTEENLDTNAADIVRTLGIDGDDRGLANLPLHYSYGLSILNSHLRAGACTVLTPMSPVEAGFVELLRGEAVTSLPGVPYSYQMYRRVKLFEQDLPALRYATQAGGRLDDDSILAVHDRLTRRGCRFHVMYGQTEASPRMSTLASEDLPELVGSVGHAMASGSFEIADPDEFGTGEIVYNGANVMLGYAESRGDLGQRSHHGSLATGDLGRLDCDGRLSLSGRIKRIAKLYGTRINLTDVEAAFAQSGTVAAVEGSDVIHVFAEREADGLQPPLLAVTAKSLQRRLKVPARSIRLHDVDQLPLNANGKVDYRRLASEI